MSCKNRKIEADKSFCYATEGSYKLDFVVKTQEFRDFNALLQALRLRKGTLLSYIDYNSFIKATIRYNK